MSDLFKKVTEFHTHPLWLRRVWIRIILSLKYAVEVQWIIYFNITTSSDNSFSAFTGFLFGITNALLCFVSLYWTIQISIDFKQWNSIICSSTECNAQGRTEPAWIWIEGSAPYLLYWRNVALAFLWQKTYSAVLMYSLHSCS